MSWKRVYLFLFAVGLAVNLAVASLQSLPGYMDADYYYGGGLQLASGKGFTEPYLWNYLDDPDGLPHPSHTYWMPLASIVASAGMLLTGQLTYASARLGFILIAACIPPLTASLAKKIGAAPQSALASGLLAAFSIYHAPFMPVSDNFGILMLLGGLFFLFAADARPRTAFVIGLLAGLMNLARNDGVLWLGMALLLALWHGKEDCSAYEVSPVAYRSSRIAYCTLRFSLLALFGYMLVMAPWYLRNYSLFGSPFAPASERALWLTSYSDTFAYPPERVNYEAWRQAGWSAALAVRLWALRFNLLNAFAAQGGIVLFPFILIGLWRQRRDLRARLALIAWLLLLAAMTLVFPFAGARGGFFHAGAALQPYWWALAPLGLEAVVEKARRRGWFTPAAQRVFRLSLVALALALTIVILLVRVVQPGWEQEDGAYARVEQFLLETGAGRGVVVIVRNPPGYAVVAGRPAIVIPSGDPQTVLAVAQRYGAGYLVLEAEGVLPPLKALYENPQGWASFDFLGEVDGARIYAIE